MSGTFRRKRNFFALCEHHALPFYSQAYAGYIAHDNIIGISKRFAVQERIGQQIAETLKGMLHPYRVAVYLEVHHLCVEMRGVRETAQKPRTTVWHGHDAEDPPLQPEFFTTCGLQRNEK